MKPEPIAITGIGCRFPGDINNPSSFWDFLLRGQDAISEIPEDRWSQSAYYHPNPTTGGKSYSKWGGFIRDIDAFDSDFFGISDQEANHIDPQQRLLLEVAWEALEDGGHVLTPRFRNSTGVFVGISTFDYATCQISPHDWSAGSPFSATGSTASVASARISYCLDLKGPAVSFDTACSSALVALHYACLSLWRKECRVALAGGTNVLILPSTFAAFCSMAALSKDGRCRAFDARADGFVRAEGAGIVSLRPLEDALANGDHIYAIIRGTGVNQDGKTTGLTFPNQESQEALILETCRYAGVSPNQVRYVEAHGTGTPVGDPIEAAALGATMGRGRSAGDELLIGSVKSNIGHLEAAAGIAGLIKASLVLEHGIIPPSLHFETPNPAIDFESLHLRVVTKPEPIRTIEPGIAGDPSTLVGLNSFGFGGTNVFAILDRAPLPERKVERVAVETAGRAGRGIHLMPLSAATDEALKDLAAQFASHLAGDGGGDGENGDAGDGLPDVVYSASQRRNHHRSRLALVGRTEEELAEKLNAFSSGEDEKDVHHRDREENANPVFVYSGQGAQWFAMGRRLYECEPVFRKTLEACHEALRDAGGWSLLDEFLKDEEHSRMADTAIAQPSIFALQVALTALWESWGIRPSAVVGHSVGEVAAAHTAGILDLGQAMKVIYHRGRCMDAASSEGRMLAAGITAEEAEQLIAPFDDNVSLAAINSPQSVTLSGDPDDLAVLAGRLEKRQLFNRFVPVNYAFHSAQMDPIRDELLEALKDIRPRTAKLPIISTVTGERIEAGALGADYWWQNVRKAVRFGPAIHELIKAGHRIFLELSAHPVLGVSIKQCLASCEEVTSYEVLPSLHRDADDQETMLGSLGALYCLGCDISWDSLYEPGLHRFVPLPRYSWQHKRYWSESPTWRQLRLAPMVHPFLAKPIKAPNPTWQVSVNRHDFPYMNDHRIRDQKVFPGAGYVEMALAMAQQVLSPGPCRLGGVEFKTALFLPEGDGETKVQIRFDPGDNHFKVFSSAGDGAADWTLNSEGTIHAGIGTSERVTHDVEEIRRRCPVVEDARGHYHRIPEGTLNFGPMFQRLGYVWCGQGEALGEIIAPDELRWDIDRHNLHPCLLDACFQLTFGTIPDGARIYEGKVLLPVEIDRVTWFDKLPHEFLGYARLKRSNLTTIETDLYAVDKEGRELVRIEGLRVQAAEGIPGEGKALDDLFYESKWFLKPLPREKRLTSPTPLSAFLSSADELKESLEARARALRDSSGVVDRYLEVEPMINRLCTGYLIDCFTALGWQPEAGERITLDDALQRMGIESRYLQYLRQSFGWLEGEGYIRRDEGADSREWMVVKPLRANETTDELWRESILHDPARLPEFLLLKRCGPNLPQILTGRIDPLSLLFESDTTHVLEHLYASATMSRGANEITKDLVGQLVRKIPKGRFLSVLEIGAGLGGSTSYLLPLLPKTQCRYTYTDISQNLLSLAEDRFRDYPFVEYEHLDIEKHPSDQGFHEGQYDLVIAAHVLHATANLRETLEHVKWLMAPGGLGITVEMDVPIRFVSFIFGLLDGWWRFKDHDLRADSPTLGRDEWIRLLEECGFIDPVAASVTDGKSESGLAVLLARREIAAGGEITESVPADSVSMETDTNEHPATNPFWLIFADRRGTGDRLARLLEPRGHRTISVATGADYSRLSEDRYEIQLGDPEHMKRLLRETVGNDGTTCAGIVHLWCLDTPDTAGMTLEDLVDAQRLACHSILHLTQGLIDQNISGDSPPPLNLVTCNAQPVSDRDDPLSLAQTSVVGLARVISVEQPELQSRMVDLSDPQNERQLRDLASELLFADDGEREIALRQEGRFVQRIAGATTSGQTSSVSEDEDLRPYRLEPGKHFGLDELAFRPVTRKAPGPGEIEISIAASGLNFRDVMKALGIYPSDAQDVSLLGDECAGHVTRVGTGVSGFQPGDRVVAVASGCFGSWATVEAVRAMPLPSGFTLEEGATLLIAYGTAYHALHTLGQMSKGERVLIHAGAGGVGLAAVQLAMAAGAEVFATAGSPLKRDFLRGLGVDHVMDSRSLDFADEIMQITRGEGIDIVLNSLAGQAIARSLELLRVNGRFLEIGKRDIYGGTRISLKPFRNSLSYMAIDLARLMDPSRIEPLFVELRKSFESGAVRPLPYRVFPMSSATDAFRYMAKAHHIGKVVLSTESERLTPVPTPSTSPLKLRTDATYLVIGGLRGLGLAFAEWLADRGARHLVLTSRTGLTRDDAREGVARLRSLGVEVWAVASDAGSEKDLAELLDRIRQSMPPLRGVVHSPLVLSDRMLDQEDVENFELPMRAKAYGAWNLHLQTKEIPLDFFVLVSSMSSIIGNPGQANYAAANAFEDALAHYRSRSGLPALSFNLGRLSGVGYLNRSKELDDFFQRIGWASLSPSKVFSAVERLLVNGATQMVVTNVNWPAFLRKSGFGKNSTRYELLLGAEEEGESRIASIREELFAAAPQDRPAIIERFMRQQVAKVLRLSAAKLDPNRPLTELGLDSLAGVELLARLESQIGMSTSPTRLMKNATLSQLAETMLIAVMGEGSAGPPTDGLRRPETQLDADDLDIATTADETDRARAESEAAREAAGVDPAADALLGETVPIDGESFDIDLLSNPKAVLLTGASGFLGVHLLAELLSQTTADVYSLVRAESEEEGWQRLREKFDTHRVTIPNDRLERVKIVLGDLAKPRLGWSRARFEELSERIDVVYHNGADVNLLLPYPILRSTNVLGTREVLALAGSRRLKAVHFTSSIGVFSDKDAEDGSTITESRLPGNTVRYTSGYGESKRVAEVMARTVGNLGLPITIHRPGLLLGNPRTGVTGPTDFLPLLLKTCIEFGQAPNSGTNLYLTPVDYAARSLVWLSLQPVSLGRISHLIGASRISLNDLISLARQMGYEIRTVEFDDWAKELTKPAIQRMNHPFAPFLSDQYLDRVSAIRLIVNTQMSINDDATRRSLAPSRIECPTLDASALAAYFDYFITIGFFPPPGRGAVSAADLSR